MFLLLMDQRQQRVDRLAQAAVIVERMAILWSIAGGARQAGVNFTGVFTATVFQARARYQSALLPVCLQVSPEILRQRLRQMGA